MYIKQKRGNFKLKKCVYIQLSLPFRVVGNLVQTSMFSPSVLRRARRAELESQLPNAVTEVTFR